MTDLPAPDHLIDVGQGRKLAFDDRGDPGGEVVLFFHGTPDTRLARHPDDEIAHRAGLRLIAADRPGLGSSDVDPEATPSSVADDSALLLDHLGAEDVHVIAWSAGTIPALAFAGGHAHRTASLTLIAPLIPADAYDAPGVLEGAEDSRRLFADVHGTMSPGEAGRELAMWLVPPEIDERLAHQMLDETIERLRGVPGAATVMVAALRGSVVQGMTGLEREIVAQATPLGALLDEIRAPVTIHAGAADTVTPPAMAQWLERRLGGDLHLHDAGHHLAITHWAEILDGIRRG